MFGIYISNHGGSSLWNNLLYRKNNAPFEASYVWDAKIPSLLNFLICAFKCTLIDWLWWGETTSQNCDHQRSYCSSPGDMWAWSAMVIKMMMPAGNNSWLVHHSSLTVLPADTSGASRRNGRRSENFAEQDLKYLKGYLTCRKILRQGNSDSTSHLKESVLRIFTALKNPSPRPVWTPRPFVPMASTLTTTPPRQQNAPYCLYVNIRYSHKSSSTSHNILTVTKLVNQTAFWLVK
jgi:hypothetical protein